MAMSQQCLKIKQAGLSKEAQLPEMLQSLSMGDGYALSCHDVFLYKAKPGNF